MILRAGGAILILAAASLRTAAAAADDDRLTCAALNPARSAQPARIAACTRQIAASGAADPWLRHGYLYRARAHAILGDPARAIADASAAITLDPADPIGWLSRAGFHEANGDLAAAIADYDAALAALDRPAAVPDIPTRAAVAALMEDFRRQMLAAAHLARGNAHAGRQDWARAVADYDAVLADDDEPRAFAGRAFALAALGEPARAVDDFTAALRAAPHEAALLVGRGRGAARRGALTARPPHSGAAPTGGPPGGRCRKVSEA